MGNYLVSDDCGKRSCQKIFNRLKLMVRNDVYSWKGAFSGLFDDINYVTVGRWFEPFSRCFTVLKKHVLNQPSNLDFFDTLHFYGFKYFDGSSPLAGTKILYTRVRTKKEVEQLIGKWSYDND